jgi:Ca2+-binding RTX toxin-like protein
VTDAIQADSSARNTIYGGQGNDRLVVTLGPPGDAPQFVQGNKGDDTLQGGQGMDTNPGWPRRRPPLDRWRRAPERQNLGNDVVVGAASVW